MKSKYLFFALLAFIIFGCGDNNTNPDNSSKEIYPLAVGNSWSYQVMSYHGANKNDVIILDTVTVTIIDKININGEEWFYGSNNGKKLNQILTIRKDGIWEINFQDSTKINSDFATMTLKYPTFINDRVSSKDGLQTVSLNSEITTPLGIFSCIKYVDVNEPSHAMFYSPGIGFIKSVEKSYINPKNPSDTTWEATVLYKYNINPK